MSSRPTRDPLTGFAIPTAQDMKRTLGVRLAPTVDRARDIPVRLGLRPYRISLVLLKYTGGRRDAGDGYEIARHPILPVPLLADLTGLARPTTAGGADEIGTLLLSRIPLRFGENVLRGLDRNGNPPEPDQKFLVEVVFVSTGQDERRAFTVASVPSYSPTGFQWSMVLERASVRDWQGRPEGA